MSDDRKTNHKPDTGKPENAKPGGTDGKADKDKKKLMQISVGSAIGFIVMFGFISMFADMTYEGGRSMVGQFLKILGASAAAVGVSAGAGEFLGYAIRFISGYFADKTQRYWATTIFGYVLNLFALPFLALIGHWQIAIILVFVERIGKAIRNPARDAMLSHATSATGRGFGFGLHEAMDQIGAFLGPVALSAIIFFKNRAEGGGESLPGYQLGFTMLFIPAVIALVILLATRFVFPRPRELEVKTPQIAMKGFSKAYWWYLGAVALVAAGFADFPLIAYHFRAIQLVPEHWIPTMYAVAMAVDAASALFFGRLYDKKGFWVLILVFGITAIFAPFVYIGGYKVFAGSPIPAIIGMSLWGIGMGAQESIMRAAVADLVPPTKRGTAYGLFHTGFGVLWFGGSALMGVLYDWNIYAIVIFSVFIQLAAIPVFFKAYAVRKKEMGDLAEKQPDQPKEKE